MLKCWGSPSKTSLSHVLAVRKRVGGKHSNIAERIFINAHAFLQ